MTVAELGFRFILQDSRQKSEGFKIAQCDLKPEDIDDVKSFLGKKYLLTDIITKEKYVFDLTKSEIKNNVLIFKKGKPNFYKV